MRMQKMVFSDAREELGMAAKVEISNGKWNGSGQDVEYTPGRCSAR